MSKPRLSKNVFPETLPKEKPVDNVGNVVNNS